MKFANKLMLAVTLLGVGGATISAVQYKTGDNVAHADTPVRRYYEYRRIRGRLYYRSVLKGYANGVGWVYGQRWPLDFNWYVTSCFSFDLSRS